jgi:hypothetical protein
MERLNRWACIELFKLEPGQHPEQITNGISHHSEFPCHKIFKCRRLGTSLTIKSLYGIWKWEQMQKEGNSDQKRERRRRCGS